MKFTEFLLKEVEMSLNFDPDKESPQDILSKARVASRMGAQNPQRFIKQRAQNIRSKMRNIAQSDDPLEQDRIAIMKLEQRIVQMKQVLQRKEEMLRKQGKLPAGDEQQNAQTGQQQTGMETV